MIDWKFIIAEVRRQLTSIELVKPFFPCYILYGEEPVVSIPVAILKTFVTL